jgi:hypothetical protein
LVEKLFWRQSVQIFSDGSMTRRSLLQVFGTIPVFAFFHIVSGEMWEWHQTLWFFIASPDRRFITPKRKNKKCSKNHDF